MAKDRISQKRRNVFLPEVSREDPEQAFVGFRFIGVRNLTVRDVTLEDHQSCGMLFCNWENVSVENVYLEIPDPLYCQSLDSLHILQPGQQFSVDGLHFRSGSDEYLT
ncbi:MAG: hypothetical protein E7486_03105 [Ruminococcaceae bacterium]|nr:hypothetical protein [Oscillospiraceae bacterium]